MKMTATEFKKQNRGLEFNTGIRTIRVDYYHGYKSYFITISLNRDGSELMRYVTNNFKDALNDACQVFKMPDLAIIKSWYIERYVG